MYSFVDQLRQHRRELLLLFAALATCAVICQGQDSSFSLSISSGEPLLPCVYRGIPYLHGEEWKVDECTTCACNNATTTCVIESCQPAFCAEPIKPEGECCFLCPYNVRVKKVTPQITSTTTIAEGGDNRLRLNVPIRYQEAQDTTGVYGEGLWRLSMWASPTNDGRGSRYGYSRNVIDETQMAQYYKKKEPFQFMDVNFEFNDPMAECSDMAYICARLDRGDNPVTKGGLDYEFSGWPDESAQTGCVGAPECKGVVAEEFEWTLQPLETVIPGQSTSVSIDSSVFFREGNPTLSGRNLWRQGIFGSRNAQGTGDRFSYVSQTLSRPQQGTTLMVDTPLETMDAVTDFELGSVGCNDYGYVCLEFTGGENPTPNYFFRVSGAADNSRSANTITRCKEQECLANVWATSLDWSLTPTDTVLPGVETGVSLDSTVFFQEDNREVMGSGLWRMGLYGSRSRDGSGEKFNYKTQTLNREQEGITLAQASSLDVPGATTDFMIGTVGCNDFGYVCVEFTGGDDPSPLYYFRVEGSATNRVEDNTLVECKEQECLSKAIFTDLTADLGDQVMYENKNNPLTVDLVGITADDSTNVAGEELWMVGAYASMNPEGTGTKTGLVEQILDPAGASTTLNEAEDLPMDGTQFEFDMTGIRCADAPYLCFDLDKNPKASVDFIFEDRPDESVTTTCIDMTDRCKGATAIDVEWEAEVGDAPFGQPSPLSIDASVLFDPDSPDVNGQGLWQLGVFAANMPDGSGPRRDEVTQTLDPFNQAKPLEEGGPLDFGNIDVPFPIDELGCDEFRWLCIEFKKGEGPDPDFGFATESGEDSIISCKEQKCRGVEIDSLTSTPTDVPTDLMLYEGKPENPLTYNSVATTTDETGTARGVDLWTLSQWGSENANGDGPQNNYQEQVLSDYFAALPVMNKGDTLDFVPLVSNFDMTGLKCPQVKYICNEINRDPESQPEFQFTGVPDESVLRSCFEVPDDACKGVIFTDLDWDMTPIGPVKADEPDNVVFNVDLDTLPNSGSADGDGLWRIGVFGSTMPDGGGPRLGYMRQILDRAESSTPAEGGGTPLELKNLATEFDLSQIGCDSDYKWLCLEFSKGLRANPDFEIEMQGNGDAIISCKEQPCRRPVIVTDVETDLLGNGRVAEGTRNNRILYDMTAVADPSSGKAQGRDLWELTTFGSTFADGRGQRFKPETAFTFTQYQKDRPAFPGENIRYGAVDTNFDMTGLTCNQINYFCSELRKGEYASPDFQFVAKPDEEVLVDCFELNCEGVLIDNTRLTLNSDDELGDGPNELSFDFRVDSNPTGGDAEGNNLWRLATFTSNNNDGSGRRDILRQQNLDPADASQDLDSGNTMVFRNLQAMVDSADVNCDEDYYLCAELTKHESSSPDFSMRGTREDSLTSCKLIKCAKAEPPPIQGRPGPKGAPGEPFSIPPGMVGPPGRPGLPGSTGYRGKRGPNGLGGPPGFRGEDGRDGNPGRRGHPGQPGPPGPPGEARAAAQTQSKGPAWPAFTFPGYGQGNIRQGPIGLSGYAGTRGARGPAGIRGPPGLTGPGGAIGSAGERGMRGQDGDDGRNGKNGSPGQLGLPGEPGRGGSAGTPGRPGQYGHKGWTGRMGRKGAQGDSGQAGARGEDGISGSTGAVGNPGARGPTGATGSTGAKGIVGERGTTGETGPAGNPGNTGPIGNMGASGLAGHRGASGEVGGQGTPGTVGLMGETGKRGANGLAGSPGVPGVNGDSGSDGDIGVGGDVGMPGQVGAPGTQGQTGSAGVEGERGNQGSVGFVGAEGSRGPAGARGQPGVMGEPGSRGSQGDEGENGLPGSSGPRGPIGEAGPQGAPGLLGAGGLNGAMGDSGEAGSPGTPGEAGTRGTAGTPGTPGQNGANGAPGEDGQAGSDGKVGPTGSEGKDGSPGANGERGATGPPGQQGPPGVQGEAGFTGNTGAPGNPGTRGDSGEEGEPGPAGQVGAAGAPGRRGDDGPQGDAGVAGSQGPAGNPGSDGARGSRGDRGPPGPTGTMGGTGDVGEQGLRGAAGLQGPNGLLGERGTDGRAGRQGEVGLTGSSGVMGPPGLRGLQGPPGLRGGVGQGGEMGESGDTGVSGQQGSPGRTGERGSQGPMGPVGASGMRGDNGESGGPGTNGNDGAKGVTGAAGTKGTSGPRGIPGNPGVGGAPGERGPAGNPGEKGEAGPTGSQGRVGRVGQAGLRGARGPRGDLGNEGPVGPLGSPGMSGPPGARGEQGLAGPTGPNGKTGDVGTTGPRGPQGNPGLMGERGLVGPIGPPGARGEDGRDGNMGPRGAVGAAGTPGQLGPGGLAGITGPPGGAGGPGRPGPEGEQGVEGQAGERGEDGQRGPNGAQGSPGIPGSTGRDGKDGKPGPKGAEGRRGDTGAKGADGVNGNIGPRGPVGPLGSEGARGNRGKAGAQGTVGNSGEPGPMGPVGPAGPAGSRGETGSQGVMGHKGQHGMPGAPGPDGKAGETGTRGEAGSDGVRGLAGNDGLKGKNGKEGPRGPPGLRGNNGQRGERGGSGTAGPAGPPGPPGPPGEVVGMGYAYQPPAQQQSKGPSQYSHYYRDEVPKTVEELDRSKMAMYLQKFEFQIQSMYAPIGSREQPVRSCKDLFKCFPNADDGDYWIDSNEGSIKDAYLAKCIKKGADGMPETCISPRTSTISRATWYMGAAGSRYISNMDGLQKFSYDANEVQMTFLRLLSNKAHQNVTYECKNSVAVVDGRTRENDKALRLMTTSDVELSPHAPGAEQYEIIEDGCQHHTGEWSQTVINYSTRRNTRLPIVDIAPSDIGRESQEFGIILGPVCFS